MLLVYDLLRYLKQKKHHSFTCFKPTQAKYGPRGRPKGNSLTVILFCILITRINTLVRKLIPPPFPENVKPSDVSCVTVL